VLNLTNCPLLTFNQTVPPIFYHFCIITIKLFVPMLTATTKIKEPSTTNMNCGLDGQSHEHHLVDPIP
jgi:hypothetical protein